MIDPRFIPAGVIPTYNESIYNENDKYNNDTKDKMRKEDCGSEYCHLQTHCIAPLTTREWYSSFYDEQEVTTSDSMATIGKRGGRQWRFECTVNEGETLFIPRGNDIDL